MKLDAADEAYKKISKIGLREEEFACHKLSETVFLKLIELEYKGITYDMNLLYGSMKKLVIPMETRDIERLMKIQKRIDHDGINIIEDFNFEREMKRYKHEIAEIVYPDSIEIGITEINRRILRYKDLWVAISQWYGALREYADFGTMVALVQIDKQMRAGAFALDYLSAYKGDKGKKLVIKFIKNLPQEKYAVEILMKVLFFQILQNLGFKKSIFLAADIMVKYGDIANTLFDSNKLDEIFHLDEILTDNKNIMNDIGITSYWNNVRKNIRSLY